MSATADRYERHTYTSNRDRCWAEHARQDLRDAHDYANRFNTSHRGR